MKKITIVSVLIVALHCLLVMVGRLPAATLVALYWPVAMAGVAITAVPKRRYAGYLNEVLAKSREVIAFVSMVTFATIVIVALFFPDADMIGQASSMSEAYTHHPIVANASLCVMGISFQIIWFAIIAIPYLALRAIAFLPFIQRRMHA